MSRFWILGVAILQFMMTNGMEFKGVHLPDNLNGKTYEINIEEKWARPVVRGRECTAMGPMCEDCYSSSLCVPQGDGWIKYTVDCSSTETCHFPTGLCVASSQNPDCPPKQEYKFECSTEGMYPDPFDCKGYHICYLNDAGEIEKTPTTERCSLNYYYNARTTHCSALLKPNNTCPTFGNPCKENFETFPIRGNNALYYTCLLQNGKLVPQALKCPVDQLYNIHTKKCENQTPVSLLNPNTGRCQSLGKFFDLTNCLYYRECRVAGNTPDRRPCPSGTYFDPIYRDCVEFTCRNVDNY